MSCKKQGCINTNIYLHTHDGRVAQTILLTNVLQLLALFVFFLRGYLNKKLFLLKVQLTKNFHIFLCLFKLSDFLRNIHGRYFQVHLITSKNFKSIEIVHKY